MSKPKWPETLLIQRLSAAETSGDVSGILREIRKTRLSRNFVSLRRAIISVGRLFKNIPATTFYEETLDHVENERTRQKRRTRQQ